MRNLLLVLSLSTVLAICSACGGESKPASMPSLLGKRLDVAKDDLKSAGVDSGDVDVVGGGTFGVVDESNWTVCAQKPKSGSKVGSKVRVIVDRECTAEDSNGPSASAKSPSSSPVPSKKPRATSTTDQSEGPTSDTFKMPELVGKNLQDAQDQLQSLGSYVLDQTDARGLDRLQILDSNWTVCSQKPRAGSVVPSDKRVTLASVKLAESCP